MDRSSFPASVLFSGSQASRLQSTSGASSRCSVLTSSRISGTCFFLCIHVLLRTLTRGTFTRSLRVNHWLVLITFLQHTDPILPHYRAPEFTFPRGALSTLDRSLLGDLGPIMAWIGAHTTHGISETHVAHHVASKIPHYNASVILLLLDVRFVN